MSAGNKHNWENYIKISEIFLDKDLYPEFGNSLRRSAISRAYYGAFCLARNKAVEMKWININNSVQDHKTVKEYYIKHRDKDKNKIGLKLDRLRKKRNQADYRDTFYHVGRYAKTCVKNAKEIVINLNNIES